MLLDLRLLGPGLGVFLFFGLDFADLLGLLLGKPGGVVELAGGFLQFAGDALFFALGVLELFAGGFELLLEGGRLRAHFAGGAVEGVAASGIGRDGGRRRAGVRRRLVDSRQQIGVEPRLRGGSRGGRFLDDPFYELLERLGDFFPAELDHERLPVGGPLLELVEDAPGEAVFGLGRFQAALAFEFFRFLGAHVGGEKDFAGVSGVRARRGDAREEANQRSEENKQGEPHNG